MDKEAIEFVLESLPKGRTVYYNFADRYALLLLEFFVGDEGKSIAEIKESHFTSLLNKPSMKTILAGLGSKHLRAWDLLKGWPQIQEGYRLTLGTWPDLEKSPIFIGTK